MSVLLRAVLFLLLVTIPFLSLEAQPGVQDDPLPLKRVLIPPSRLPAELERLRPGVLVPLPRAEFEARVQKAAEGSQPRPRLNKAEYRAVLEGNSLVSGTGKWRVLNPAAATGILPLTNLNLALSKVITEDGKEAVVGDLDGKTQGLLIDKSGNQSILFDWTLRGVLGTNGLQFDLRLPSCAVSSLELMLPADQYVTVAPNVGLLTGPHESENPQQRLWRLHFTARLPVELVIRKKSALGIAPLLLTYLKSQQDLSPGRCQADFDFQVEVLHGNIDQLVFDCDPGLEPYDVSNPNLELMGWELQEPAPPKDKNARPTGNSLVVKLRESFQGKLSGLRIRCLASGATEELWTSPGIRLRNAIGRGETLKVNLQPEVRLEKWNAGQFRLMKSVGESDGSQTLFLLDSGDNSSPRPSAILKTQGVDLLTRQQIWWQIAPRSSTIATEIALEVRRGKLFQIALKLPPAAQGWRVESVMLDPKNMLRNYAVVGNLLVVDLDRAINPGRPAKLKVRLGSPLGRSISAAGLNLDFPDMEIAEPCLRTGTLAISVDPLYQAAVVKSSLPAMAVPAAGPWGSRWPNFSFPFRNQKVTGKLRLLPYPYRVNARAATEVMLASASAALSVRLELEPVVGNPNAIDLYLSAPPRGCWQWKSKGNLVRAMERLPIPEVLPHLLALGTRNPIEMSVLEELLPRGQLWQLTFSRPLDRRQVVTLATTLEPAGLSGEVAQLADKLLLIGNPTFPNGLVSWFAGHLGGPRELQQDWEVPLVSIPQVEHLQGEVTLQLIGTELLQIKAEGMHEAGFDDLAKIKMATAAGQNMRTFRYRHGVSGAYPRLSLRSRPLAIDAGAREVCDRAELTNFVESQGGLLHHFRFQVWNWDRRDLTLLLPEGTARILGARADGHWIDRLAHEKTPAGMQVMLPVPEQAGPHQFEILYASDPPGQTWLPWSQLKAQCPKLPVTPTSLRLRWRLPPGQVPLWQGSYQCLTGPEKTVAGQLEKQSARRIWQAGDPLLAGFGVHFSPDWQGPQRQLMAGAESAVRRRITKEWHLGDVLERLAVQHLQDQALVIDVAAVHAAGLKTTTLLPGLKKSAPGQRPFWAEAGLVYVPCPGAPLLTTRAKLESWPGTGGGSLAEAFAAAVREAAVHGQDRSGRFRTVDNWLRSAEDNTWGPMEFQDISGQFPGWSEWEPLAGSSQPDQIVIVNQTGFGLIGLGLALGLTFLACRLRSWLSPGWRFRLLLSWLAAAGLVLLWAPAGLRPAGYWLFLAPLGLVLIGYVRSLFRSREHDKSPSGKFLKPATTAAALLLVVLPAYFMPAANSGGQESYTVFLLPGPKDAPQKQTAYVSEDLLKRLDELARRGIPSLDHAVLIRARYTGTVNGGLADFKADFDCYSFADNANLTIPLGGVDLKEGAFLDGRPVFPVAVTEPEGYALQVKGKGFHLLTLSFSVRLAAAADGRELRFLIPKLAQSQLELSLPGQVQAVQAVNAAGDQRLTETGKNLQSLHAQVGRESAIQVRWRSGGPPPAPAQVQVRELYLWDLRPPAPSLTGILQYSVHKGGMSSVDLALPEGLEVRTVEIGPVGSSVPAGQGPRLKNWRLQDNKGSRSLLVEFHGPVTGEVQVKLGLVPRLALRPGNVSLALPFPLKVKQPDVGFLAYRLEGLEAKESSNLGVVVISPKTFAEAWRGADPRSAVQPTRAFNFRRPPNAPKAALGLALAPAKPQASQEVTWQVGPLNADLTAKCTLSSAAEDLMLIEWEVPAAVVLAEVTGPEVFHWSRRDSLVQIWLTRPQKETELKLTGWVKNSQPLGAAKGGRFDLPRVRLRQPLPADTVIRIQSTPGLALKLQALQNLINSPDPEPAGSFAYLLQTPDSSYGGDFRLTAMPMQPEVHILTTAKVQDGALAFTSHLDCQAPHGELRQVTVKLNHWPSDQVKLDVAGVVVRAEHQRVQDRHTWVLNLPAGITRQFSFQISGGLSLVAAARVAMPDVSVSGAGRMERWLAVTGPDLQAETSQGLTVVKEVSKKLSRWPEEAKRIGRDGSAWQIAQKNWHLQLVPRPAAAAPLVQVLLAEQEAAVGDNRHWVHQAHYGLFSQGGTDLHLVMPAGARVLAVAMDEAPLTPRQPAPELLWLPLSGPPGPRSLRLRWVYEKGEALERPNLASPTIKGIDRAPVFRVLVVPAGFQAEATSAAAADLLFRRAEAQLQLSTLLAERARSNPAASLDAQLLAAQQAFLWYCRQTEHLAGKTNRVAQLHAAIIKLRELNNERARRLEFEKIRSLAEQQPLFADPARHTLFTLPGNGKPIYRQDSRNLPSLHLVPLADQQNQAALVTSQILLVVLVCLGILSYLPRTFAWLKRFWPEQVLFAAWLGWYLFDWSLLGIVLIFVGVCARLIMTVAWVQRLLHRPVPAGSGSSLHPTA